MENKHHACTLRTIWDVQGMLWCVTLCSDFSRSDIPLPTMELQSIPRVICSWSSCMYEFPHSFQWGHPLSLQRAVCAQCCFFTVVREETHRSMSPIEALQHMWDQDQGGRPTNHNYHGILLLMEGVKDVWCMWDNFQTRKIVHLILWHDKGNSSSWFRTCMKK